MPKGIPNKSRRGRGGNMSAMIREMFAEFPDAGPSEIVRLMKEKKNVIVTPTLVSNCKARMEGKHKTKGAFKLFGGKAGRPGKNGHVTVPALLAAKAFSARVGGIEKATTALSTLLQLSQA